MAIKDIALHFSIITDVFLRMIEMIITSLVFSTLVVGLASMSDGRSVGRVGLCAVIWFVCASVASLAPGMLPTNFFQPGMHMNLILPDVSAMSGLETDDFTLETLITHVFPRNIAEAMATNEILQILVSSLLFGTALSTMKNPVDNATGCGLEELIKLMFHITDYVMRLAPLDVFAAMAVAITVKSMGVLRTYDKLIDEFYLGLALLWAILFLAGYVLLGRSPGRLLEPIREPTLLVFATTSSESVYPRTIEALDRFGVPKRISSFVLPLDHPFNPDDSMTYQVSAALFTAQAYNVEASFTQQVMLLLVLMLTNKGMTSVARASLVVVVTTLPMFHLPKTGLLLIIGISQFFDMDRTAANVTSNSLVTAMVAKYEPTGGEAAADVAEPAMQPVVG